MPSYAKNVDAPIVLELFTSQSCSSCPPADKFLGELAAEENIIALSCNVTYWNYLHWEDTLSHDFCTDRQRRYAGARATGRVFTPELLVNGQISTVGSQRGQVRKALRNQAGKVFPIKVKHNALAGVKISLPDMPKGDGYLVEVIAYGEDHSQAVPSGENAGKTLHYTNPVKAIMVVEKAWQGDTKNFVIQDQTVMKGAKGLVVLVHQSSRAASPIIAAGSMTF